MAPNDNKNSKQVLLTSKVNEKSTNNNKNKKDGTSKISNDLVTTTTLSEEDKALKERIDTCVSTILDSMSNLPPPPLGLELRMKALDILSTELQSATSSMTSVPKPLKFLRPYFQQLKKYYTDFSVKQEEKKDDGDAVRTEQTLSITFKAKLADVLAVLAMTLGKSEDRECLRFKLFAKQDYDTLHTLLNESQNLMVDDTTATPTKASSSSLTMHIGSWGHEFVRTLAGEIGQEYNHRVLTQDMDPSKDENFQDLLDLVETIVPFHITHNAEAEAVDLLIEVQRLKFLLTTTGIDEKNYSRICLYLLKTADYMSDPDDLSEMLDTAYHLFLRQHKYYDALRVVLRSGKVDEDTSLLHDLFGQCTDPIMKKQMCLLLARHRVHFEVNDDFVSTDEDALEGMDTTTLNEIIGNVHLSEHYLKVAQDLDVMDAKTPEDIYKSHLAETAGFSRRSARDIGNGQQVDSARANLASTFVNAFVNAGFGQDKLMTPDNEWLYKNKDHGMMFAAASLGMILLWNVEEGLSQVDKFLYSNQNYVKAGALLAVGILSSGIRNDADPAAALLTEHLEGDSHENKIAACTGMGIAYAGTGREDIMELILPMVEASGGGSQKMLEVSLAGLALGMIFVGKCNETVGSTIIQRIMEATEEELNHSHARFLCIGLGLLFLGKMERADAMLEAIRTVEHKIAKYAAIVLETFAYAGSGNVLEVQEMLHQCAEHLTEDAEHQAAAVIGIGLITLGEDVGAEMALRAFDHLLHYCELPIKRAVPLALALLHVSNPEFSVIDQLSRLTHDPDLGISQNAILAMGITSAGTNNSRVAGLLRQLSDFYNKDAGHIFCVRIAQGLLHMGKGLLTLNPIHSDRLLTNASALGALLVIIHSCLDLKNTILDKSHYLLYYLVCGMHPKMLVTVNEDLSWRPVTVRVGQAVETVGQAGKPKTITGFQTHTTPVLLGVNERAEFGTEEVLSVSSVLEGIVIVKDNPDYKPEEK